MPSLDLNIAQLTQIRYLNRCWLVVNKNVNGNIELIFQKLDD